jgi:hypothetical protein
MGRIRTVKPELFRHEGLQDLERDNPGSHCMLVFVGLFTVCDKGGRFEFKPRTLKLDILPFLDLDLENTLDLLESAGFIIAYEVDGKRYGLIPSFSKHQRITGKEADSPNRYPDPVEPIGPRSTHETLEKQRGNSGETPVKYPGAQEKEKEKEREGNKNTPLPPFQGEFGKAEKRFSDAPRTDDWALFQSSGICAYLDTDCTP